MSQFFVINNEHTLKQTQQNIAAMFNKHKWLKVTPSTQKRSLDANALSHVWYAELSKQMGDQSAFDYKSVCKLHHGVPILRRDSEKFNAFYNRFFINLSYPEKLAAVKYLSVTSLFDKTQMTEYLSEIQKTYGPKGIVLSNAKEAAGL